MGVSRILDIRLAFRPVRGRKFFSPVPADRRFCLLLKGKTPHPTRFPYIPPPSGQVREFSDRFRLTAEVVFLPEHSHL